MNIKFNYLFRDGYNYKNWHSEVFSNVHGISIDEIENVIKPALIDETWFYNRKCSLKDLRTSTWDYEIDPTWHEYENVELTDEVATKGDIYNFLILIGESERISLLTLNSYVTLPEKIIPPN